MKTDTPKIERFERRAPCEGGECELRQLMAFAARGWFRPVNDDGDRITVND